MKTASHFTLELREEIESTAQYVRDSLSPEIKRLISLCNADLYHGPVYLDPDGEECTCFDENAKAFRFTEACAKIADALSDVSDLQAESYYDPETEESEYERVDGTREAVIAEIVGRELARYVI